MRVYNIDLINNPKTLNTSFATAPLQLNQMFGYCVQAVWTGTPNGAFKLQISADPNLGAPYQPTHWTDLSGSALTVTSAGDYMWNVFDSMYNWVRVVYTDASGGASTAVLTDLRLNSKGN